MSETTATRRGPVGRTLWLLVRLVSSVLGSIYVVITRTILFIAAVYLTLHFYINTTHFKDVIQQELAGIIPGTITAATVTWGPLPWEVRIADGQILGEHGQPVIETEAVIANVDLGGTARGLLAFLLDEDAPLEILIEHASVGRTHVSVDVDEQGQVSIERAFHIRQPGEQVTVDNLNIRVASADVFEASAIIRTPSVTVRADDVSALATWSLTGDARSAFYVPQGVIGSMDVSLTAPIERGRALAPRVIPLRDIEFEGLSSDHDFFRWSHSSGLVADGNWTWAGTFDASQANSWTGEGEVWLPDGSTLTRDIFGDLVTGEARLKTSGDGTFARLQTRTVLESDRLVVGGVVLDDVRVDFQTLPQTTPRDPDKHAYEIHQLDARLWGGRVTGVNAFYGQRETRPWLEFIDGSFQVTGVDLRRAGAQVIPGLNAEEFAGTLDGQLELKSERDLLTGATRVETTIVSAQLEWPGSALMPLGGSYNLAGALVYDLAARTDPSAVREERLDLERFVLDGLGNRVRAAGTIDLARGQLNLTPYLRVGDLSDTAKRMGWPNFRGRLVLKAASLEGPLAKPRLSGDMNWTNAGLEKYRYERVRGKVRLEDGVLHARSMKSNNEMANLDVDGQLRVFKGPWGPYEPELPFKLTRVNVTKFDGTLINEILPYRFNFKGKSLSGSLSGDPGEWVGNGTFDAQGIELGSERVQKVSGEVSFDAEGWDVTDVTAVLSSGQTLSGAMGVRGKNERLTGLVKFRQLPLRTFRAVRRGGLDLGGEITAHLDLGGTLSRPTVLGSVGLAALRFGNVELGDASLELSTLPDGRWDLSSASFFDGFELLDGSALTMDGLTPKKLRLRAKAVDVALHERIPTLAGGDFRLTTSAVVALDLWPQRNKVVIKVDAAPGELAVGLRSEGLSYANVTPLAVREERGSWRLEPVTFQSTEGNRPDGATRAGRGMTLCGSVSPKRVLNAQIAGGLELGLIRLLKDYFSVVEGSVAIAEDPLATRLAARGRCIPDDTTALLHIGGPLSEPRITGRVEPRSVTLVPRSMGREIRLSDTSAVALRSGDDGVQRIMMLEGHGLQGELEDGRFQLLGELVMRDYNFEDADLEILGTDLSYTSRGEFTATFNPRGSIRVRDFGSDDMQLSLDGEVRITEGRYFKSFDTLARSIGGAISGVSAAYETPLTETLPWLEDMALNVSVTSNDFRMESDFPLGKATIDARLDLSLAGTVKRPEVYRRVDLLPGGALIYRIFGREFEIVRGFVDFDGNPDAPTLDVSAQTEILYLARGSSETQDADEKEVVITLRIYGRVPDLRVEITSDDETLDQADLQSLLLTGKPRRNDLDRSRSDRVITADLAETLNDVLKSPFLRTASVGLNVRGDQEYTVGTCFSPDLCFRGTAVRETTETRLQARFRLQLGDNLTCDGTLRRSDAATSTEDSYRARCRYRIPLD